MSRISHYNSDLCHKVDALCVSRKAILNVDRDGVAKGTEVELDVEYANPEELFHLSVYVDGDYRRSRFSFIEDSAESLMDAIAFLTDDVTFL